MTFFITLEGIDGAGKSTHVDFIKKCFEKKTIPCELTREPGGTVLGEKIREILLHDDMTVSTETLLMFASRNEHVNTFIKPKLKNSISIICDRFTDASYAYQYGGKGIDPSWINILTNLVHPELKPDLTFIFDIDPSEAKARISIERELDKFENSSLAFFNDVRNAYLELSKTSNHYCVIDSSQPISRIEMIIEKKLENIL
jgi:dTMP kinase